MYRETGQQVQGKLYAKGELDQDLGNNIQLDTSVTHLGVDECNYGVHLRDDEGPGFNEGQTTGGRHRFRIRPKVTIHCRQCSVIHQLGGGKRHDRHSGAKAKL